MRTDVSGASRTDLEVVVASALVNPTASSSRSNRRRRECVSAGSPVIISSAHIPVSRVALPTDYSTIKPTSQPICLGIEKYSLVEPVVCSERTSEQRDNGYIGGGKRECIKKRITKRAVPVKQKQSTA
ncbi:hypothetical protein QE152_g5390 [Popillia japonica]|uniref:Uncharacterized protein n=1 Tax=Popillia japonica TaxID=7064 RepID=A0AAW1MLJ3_POPJA